MFKKSLLTLAIIPYLVNPFPDNYLLARKEMSLDNRYSNQFVNNVFKDNILLNLAYMTGRVTKASDIKWDEIVKPFQYEFKLDPNKTFAFHEDVKDKYKASLVKTTNAHFNSAEGFKTDGYLFGDGICHLASLINWAAKEAGLEVEAPTNHDFAIIPDISKEYGVSIYSSPFSKGSNALQNLYITNNKGKPITFKFEYYNNNLKVSIVELN
ncbi:VanW family protein [Candidatus Daviesbacteria bacterium]|nr:VanW family protein [Candidatus Daviesbacteria bacterium]